MSSLSSNVTQTKKKKLFDNGHLTPLPPQKKKRIEKYFSLTENKRRDIYL